MSGSHVLGEADHTHRMFNSQTLSMEFFYTVPQKLDRLSSMSEAPCQ
jgi:hypothetical protein